MIGLENIQLLIDSYEETIKEITKEVDEYRIEQNNFRSQINLLLTENKELRLKLENHLLQSSTTDDINLQYKDNDFIKNLQQQLNHAIDEKDNALKLWQNTRETLEHLEEELKLYQNTIEGFVPKQELLQLKSHYEEKINRLENSLKLQEDLTITTRKIGETDQNYNNDHNLRIIQNLEKEILKLQDRLNDYCKINKQLENDLINRNDEVNLLKIRNQECCLKVQEAVMIVDGALSEKDAALSREMEMKSEIKRLTEFIEETTRTNEERFRKEFEEIRRNYDEKLQELEAVLKQNQQEIVDKNQQIQQLTRDLEIFKKHDLNDNSLSKLLILEKNLESTFQKLLFSEKQNIQLKSENESIKNDLNQMSLYYERDIKNRDAEKIQLKRDLKRLEIDLNETRRKFHEVNDNYQELKMRIDAIEDEHRREFNQQKQIIEDEYRDKINKLQQNHNESTTNLKLQLLSQRQLNKKWRTIIGDINQIFDKRLLESKQEMFKLKELNRNLIEKLRSSNNKLCEYKQLLETITKNIVGKF